MHAFLLTIYALVITIIYNINHQYCWQLSMFMSYFKLCASMQISRFLLNVFCTVNCTILKEFGSLMQLCVDVQIILKLKIFKYSKYFFKIVREIIFWYYCVWFYNDYFIFLHCVYYFCRNSRSDVLSM